MVHRCSGVVLVLVLAAAASAAGPPGRDAALFNSLPARNIGPANMGGRIVDIDVVESNPKVMYVAAASGGLTRQRTWLHAASASGWDLARPSSARAAKSARAKMAPSAVRASSSL